MYVKPTEEQISIGMEEGGLSREDAERGYDIYNFNNTGMLEINRIDVMLTMGGWEVSDEDCAKEAERSGFCKIIPVDELPDEFAEKRFGWIDTPENRNAIKDYCKNLSKDNRNKKKSERGFSEMR